MSLFLQTTKFIIQAFRNSFLLKTDKYVGLKITTKTWTYSTTLTGRLFSTVYFIAYLFFVTVKIFRSFHLAELTNLRMGWQHFSRDYRQLPSENILRPQLPTQNICEHVFCCVFLSNHIYTADIRDVINKHYILRIITGVKICVRMKSAVPKDLCVTCFCFLIPFLVLVLQGNINLFMLGC